ncbi:AmmeMemoRadiSam system protein B [bacterium]|nr:AmmeMemoRadiSam system protein B [bacterium]
MRIFNRSERKDRKGRESGGRREARFAGTWYESDPSSLVKQMDGFLESARKKMSESPSEEAFPDNPAPQGNLLALIVPHAGYMFSGATAAFAYEFAAQHAEPERIFLLGPSHYVGFEGVALSHCSAFSTPLGDLDLERKTVDELSRHPLYGFSDDIHNREHSLELQLAFLKHLFPDARLIPLVVGAFKNSSEIRYAGSILRSQIRPGDLVVVSSDFTHYGPRYDYVPFEEDFPEQVRKLDQDAFSYIQDSDLEGFLNFHDQTGCTICGFFPCSLLLSILPEGSRTSLLKYGTSRDSHKEDSRNSVSYLALVVTDSAREVAWAAESESESESRSVLEPELSEPEKKDLLHLARRVVTEFARSGRQIAYADAAIEVTAALETARGVFVTLFKRTLDFEESKERQLRGCIGYICPVKPLYQAVIDNAIGAASRDYRFTPLKANELNDLEIEISVLTPLRPVESIDEIELGVHGVVFHLGDRQSVFLPHVATEFGWSLTETLEQLAVKAGLDKYAWRRPEATFEIFESISFEE